MSEAGNIGIKIGKMKKKKIGSNDYLKQKTSFYLKNFVFKPLNAF
jgi:hypothetical protein